MIQSRFLFFIKNLYLISIFVCFEIFTAVQLKIPSSWDVNHIPSDAPSITSQKTVNKFSFIYTGGSGVMTRITIISEKS